MTVLGNVAARPPRGKYEARRKSARAALGLVAGTTVLLGYTLTAQAQAVSPPPRPYPVGEQRTESVHPNRMLLLTGGLTIAASYIPPVIVAATSDHKGDDYLYIPVAGPWLDLGNRGCDPGEVGNCGTSGIERAALIATGVAHILGVTQLALAFVVPEKRTVTTSARVGSTQIQVTPMSLGRGSYGLGAVGRF